MANKWVDNDVYYGPDRRDRDKLRFHERRRADETTEPPSIPATLRRLRVLLGGPNQEDAHARALQLVGAAIAMTHRAAMSECERTLHRAEQSLQERPDDFDAAETIVGEAMSYL